MPINKQMMADMVKRYGKKKAKDVYYAVEQKQKSSKKKPSKKKK